MDETRMLPEPHRYSVCAPADMSIKEFYKGVFEEVFIFYHPFIKPISIDYDVFNPETYPSKNDIEKNCEMVTWKQFLNISGIESYKHLDIGLRTLISGLRDKYQNEETAEVIQKVCENHKIITPTEGFFPEFLMNSILSVIKNEGHDWIWVGDEFCTERKLEYIEDLTKDSNAFRNEHLNLFTHDSKILITTHWDSHFSMLCSNRSTIDKIVKFCSLEGFYCDDHTEIYWSLFN
ncbi:DUF2711 family protein [Bacillus sp. AFS041924]|uniref:DUF2711 family protein n=1 Tax=Bacillus sp. AFS041924 TaxID=2033503 RepID=UPI000BFC2830|nr:DUF2711 family protein [Bacillus sp. AFS041924]PGS46521.1 hypothetical protein COC46_20950 [Bacillus sp. AFS041924]